MKEWMNSMPGELRSRKKRRWGQKEGKKMTIQLGMSTKVFGGSDGRRKK